MAAIGTRLLTIEIDGDAVTAQVSVAEVTSGESDSDFLTFAQAAAGGARDYKLHIVAVQDPATDTVWDKVWSAAGDTVPVVVAPFGNASPSVGQPHYEMDAVISEPEGVLLGGEADSSTSARFTIDVEWALEAKPTKVTA